MRGALIISAELIGRGDMLPSVWSGVTSEAFKYTPPYRPEFVILQYYTKQGSGEFK